MLEQLVMTYGYVVIAAGTFFEGETVLILGGYLAHSGYLELPWVIAAAFAGTLIGDQLFFYLGRKKGSAMLEKYPRFSGRAARVRRLLHRHRIAVMIGFRFVYGFRTVTPFLLGAGGIAPATFLLFNVIGALLWSVTIALLGYMLGKTVSLIVAKAHRYEIYGVFVIVFVALAVWGWRVYRTDKRGR
jgi:membrane protein DedA with SNARE-associated domain